MNPRSDVDSGPGRGEPEQVELVVRPEQLTRRAELMVRQPIWARELDNLSYEWLRLFSELFGTVLPQLAPHRDARKTPPTLPDCMGYFARVCLG